MTVSAPPTTSNAYHTQIVRPFRKPMNVHLLCWRSEIAVLVMPNGQMPIATRVPPGSTGTGRMHCAEHTALLTCASAPAAREPSSSTTPIMYFIPTLQIRSAPLFEETSIVFEQLVCHPIQLEVLANP